MKKNEKRKKEKKRERRKKHEKNTQQQQNLKIREKTHTRGGEKKPQRLIKDVPTASGVQVYHSSSFLIFKKNI